MHRRNGGVGEAGRERERTEEANCATRKQCVGWPGGRGGGVAPAMHDAMKKDNPQQLEPSSAADRTAMNHVQSGQHNEHQSLPPEALRHGRRLQLARLHVLFFVRLSEEATRDLLSMAPRLVVKYIVHSLGARDSAHLDKRSKQHDVCSNWFNLHSNKTLYPSFRRHHLRVLCLSHSSPWTTRQSVWNLRAVI